MKQIKVMPTDDLQQGIRLAVQMYGVTAATKKSGVSWTVLFAAGCGCPITKEHRAKIITNLTILGVL